ncbi:MAG: ABC transporter permease subunit [Planctomycetota bacterium]|jgi:ABC-type transport system involved in multi-copper enzyme maturation permease subunit|nr:ABC transporter permease subunit [Planctomycetota bacterium]
MFLNNNPVLQRELIVNLRTPRAFLLMLIYQIALAAVVLIAYPRDVKIDLSRESASAQRLVDFFFVGQFAIASLMAPSFTAGAISGEKERKTYEMLLASPLRPIVIVSGKLIAALAHLIVLVSGSLPIIMLCLPLGGVSIYELLAAYVGLLSSIFLFGSISMYCSSYFKRTSSSLVVSYVFILPILIVGVILWLALAGQGDLRLVLTITIVPAICLVFGFGMLAITAHRLLYPPDIGSQGNEVVDLEKEQREAVGLVIQRDQFPDSLFAPPRRKTLMADNANPVYDKEMHAELFSQGSLMLRLVIQISMLLAIPLMAVFLFLRPSLAAYYAGFVLIFNILVAPVFMAGSITSERERQTIDLLLTTTISSWQILWGKLLAGYRVSAVLTAFLMFPMVLALLPLTPLSENWPSMLAYFLICFVASVFNTILAMFLSTVVRKTSTAMMLSYVVLLGLYCLPVAIYFLVWSFAPADQDLKSLKFIGVTSPLMAVDNAPLTAMAIGTSESPTAKVGSWVFIGIYVGITTIASGILLAINVLLFQARWRLTGRG